MGGVEGDARRGRVASVEARVRANMGMDRGGALHTEATSMLNVDG